VLGASPEEIAVTASASAGINSLASALDFTGARNKVVISEFEFPTNAQIWHAQERRGAEVVHVPAGADGYIPLEHFARVIDERTQLVAVTHVCYRNGARLDIPGIARLAHEQGARVLLDTYQAVGALSVDARRMDADFIVGGMLKYLLGTSGIGFLYARSELVRDLVPSNSGWFAQEEIAAMDISANHPAKSARRFEAGTPPVVNCYAAEAGLSIILEIGTAAIEARIRALTRRCLDGLADMGWPAATPTETDRRGPMVAVPSRDAPALFEKLMERDIVTSFRNNNVRVTCHFYNNEEDIDRFLATMARHRARYRPAD
jgi:selenocysteine lyase/cysteine desulfurase